MLVLIAPFILAFYIRPVLAQDETIYINSDGSVSPPSAPIFSLDNTTYAFAGDISEPIYNGIVIDRSNIVIDGNGYTMQGAYSNVGTALNITGINNVTIANINVEGFLYGFYLLYSSDCSIITNNATSNYCGIQLAASTNNTISCNEVTANVEGIVLNLSPNNSISCNNVSGTNSGVSLSFSSNNTVTWNNVAGGGITIAFSSEDNTVSFNNETSNGIGFGILVDSSSNNTFSDNEATANYCGMLVQYSDNNTINGNDVTTDTYGIYIEPSNDNTIGWNDVTASRLQGIYISDSADSTICDNNMSSNYVGIYLGNSSCNIIEGNDATGNGIGICLGPFSDNNTVMANEVTNNTFYGIYLCNASNNIVIENTAADNSIGVCTWFSSDNNSIYHNNFLNNAIQASTYYSDGNTWDDGYPSGGNYWSNYGANDLYSGPYQNETGGDGISDTPYTIAIDNLRLSNDRDNYPLMVPFGSLQNITAWASLFPKCLNLKSWVPTFTVEIDLSGFDISSLNTSTIALNETIPAEQTPTFDFYSNNFLDLTVTFSRTELANLLISENISVENVTLSVTGRLVDGAQFEIDISTSVSSLAGDVNCDGKVDLADLTAIAYAFHSQPGDANWNDNAAFSPPWNVISLSDVVTLANHYGQHYP